MFHVVIRCNANASTGYGHFFRTLHLARALSPSSSIEGIEFLGDFDATVQAIAGDYGFACQPGSGDLLASVDRQHLKPQSILILDSYALDEAYLNEIRPHCTCLVVIDDFNERTYPQADVLINFCLKAPSYAYQSGKNLLGMTYFLCKPELESVRRRNQYTPVAEQPKQIAVLLGSCDPHNLTQAVVEALDGVFQETRIVTLDRLASRVHEKPLRHNQWQVQPFSPHIEKLYANTDLIISGGGLVKYEAAYCGIPCGSLANTEAEAKETQGFSAAGLVYDLGRAEAFSASAFRQHCQKLAEHDLRAQQRQTMLKHFPDNATQKVAQHILKEALKP